MVEGILQCKRFVVLAGKKLLPVISGGRVIRALMDGVQLAGQGGCPAKVTLCIGEIGQVMYRRFGQNVKQVCHRPAAHSFHFAGAEVGQPRVIASVSHSGGKVEESVPLRIRERPGSRHNVPGEIL
jgi:hypothetical protein